MRTRPLSVWLYRRAIVLLTLCFLALPGSAKVEPDDGSTWLSRAQEASKQGDFVAAAAHYEKAIARFRKTKKWKEVRRTLSKKGKLYRDRLGMMDQAIEAFQQIIDLQDVHGESPKKEQYQAHFYNLIGGVFQKKSEYEQAIQVYQKAQQLREEIFGPESQEVAQILTNMGTAHRFIGDFSSAIELYRRALALRLQAKDTEWPKVGIVHNQLAEVLLEMELYDEAEAGFAKAEKIFRKTAPERLDYLAEVKLGLGEVELGRGNVSAAETAFEAARALATDWYGPYDREVAQIWVALGQARLGSGAYDEAVQMFQRALTAMLPDFQPADGYENPVQVPLAADPWTFEALVGKAQAHQAKYKAGAGVSDLAAALTAYESACDFADMRRAAFWSEGAKLSLTREVYPAYEAAIGIAAELFALEGDSSYLDRAFVISERSKAALILENLGREAALPPPLLAEIKSMESQIAELEKERFQFGDSGAVPESLQQRLFDLKAQHGRKLAGLREKHLGFSPKILSAQAARQRLPDEQTVLLEYFLGAGVGYVFVLGQTQIQMIELPPFVRIHEAVNAVRAQCEKAPTGSPKENLARFSQLSGALYHLVFAPVAAQLGHVSRLIIVPDGPLWQLPFDVLLAPDAPEAGSFKQLPWLLRDYDISYAYSATLLERTRSRPSANAQRMLAIAPEYGREAASGPQASRDAAGFAPLTWSREEVREIARQFATDTLSGAAATEASFKLYADGYAGIHFSAHASVNDVDPMYSFIAFGESESAREDDSLFLYELYGMEFNAEMVVLSACETGAGGLCRGEGIVSLARGFAFGGCPAVVMSLWKADDRSTYELMGHFYRALAEGRTKSRALQQARLQYLEAASGQFAHPYYWAQFVMVGDARPVTLDRPAVGKWWMYVGLGMVIGVVVMWWLTRKKQTVR